MNWPGGSRNGSGGAVTPWLCNPLVLLDFRCAGGVPRCSKERAVQADNRATQVLLLGAAAWAASKRSYKPLVCVGGLLLGRALLYAAFKEQKTPLVSMMQHSSAADLEQQQRQTPSFYTAASQRSQLPPSLTGAPLSAAVLQPASPEFYAHPMSAGLDLCAARDAAGTDLGYEDWRSNLATLTLDQRQSPAAPWTHTAQQYPYNPAPLDTPHAALSQVRPLDPAQWSPFGGSVSNQLFMERLTREPGVSLQHGFTPMPDPTMMARRWVPQLSDRSGAVAAYHANPGYGNF